MKPAKATLDDIVFGEVKFEDVEVEGDPVRIYKLFFALHAIYSSQNISIRDNRNRTYGIQTHLYDAL